jgi:multiple antibiotic resistance protein
VPDFNFLFVSFISLIAILDPLAIVPVYLTLFTPEDRKKRAHQIALATSLAMSITLIVFLFAGSALLKFLGIGMPAFRIAGGILIFLMALQMLEGSMSRVKRSEGEEDYSDLQSYAIVPLAIPLLSGPGAMSAAILLSHKATSWAQRSYLVFVILFCAVIVYVLLRLAERADRLLGKTGIRIATRIMGLLLAAVAMQFVADGMKELFPGLVEKILPTTG